MGTIAKGWPAMLIIKSEISGNRNDRLILFTIFINSLSNTVCF